MDLPVAVKIEQEFAVNNEADVVSMHHDAAEHNLDQPEYVRIKVESEEWDSAFPKNLGEHVMKIKKEDPELDATPKYCDVSQFKTGIGVGQESRTDVNNEELLKRKEPRCLDAIHIKEEPEIQDESDTSNSAISSKSCRICPQCNMTFIQKKTLDDHIVKNHPDSISSVTFKIHNCPKCEFKTVVKVAFENHLLKHPDTASEYKFSNCEHCDQSFKTKIALHDHILKKHPSFSETVSSKVHACKKCDFKTTIRKYLSRHLLKHPESSDNYKFSVCPECNMTFRSKMSLDDHILKKHPKFIEYVTSKIHACSQCDYRTTVSSHLSIHLVKHPETASSFKFVNCVHCDGAFNSKQLLDDHIVKKHVEFSSSVTSKIHECRKCSYKTTINSDYNRHILKHPETTIDYKFSTCPHCNAALRNRITLDNHILKKHPEFSESVTTQIYKCIQCDFATTFIHHIKKHMLKHETDSPSFQYNTCKHCDATFKYRVALDNHILKKHPKFISSVISKIFRCEKCSFKTTMSRCLDRHLLRHPEVSGKLKPVSCNHCSATFRSKQGLDDHVIRKHPSFIASITCKIYECKKCNFKTAMHSHLSKHLLKLHDS
ncbi:unnamed protein product [Acanthoscelides obtectus]|uniref:C2H2-type domain-containing protein n=1 Tax=Acanthoscelides obtectus TaxID=200917 RepID=A0A9P0K5D2_ACAOB|nr:unnamed protein product [Acanthoscelides obtectus]CAK1660355.1 Zinc finger Y-chromosomal protein [Acanthoscelides obtectus]